MLRIAMCDDNLQSTEAYLRLLESIAEKNGIEISITKYSSANEILFEWEEKDRQADVLFLDIHMDEIDGMELAARLRERGYKSEIIFLTKDPGQMQKAFDVEAFHYVVKNNTTGTKFKEIFLRLVEKISQKKKEYITFSCAGENRNILVDSIRYFQVDVRVVTVYYNEGQSFEFYSTIGKIENALCAKGFIRIYRSMLVNIAYVRSATPTEVVMMDGTKLPVGRSYWKELKEELAR